MKTKWIMVVTLFLGLAATVQAAKMNVQVREGQLRERPSFLGAVVATVEYAERVRVERAQGPWRHVVSGDKEGWIHESALTRQRLEIAAGDEDVAGAATQEEMALAGKGFSADVEREYRAQHTDLDFSWVDRMEQMGVRAERLTEFLREGDVTPEGDR